MWRALIVVMCACGDGEAADAEDVAADAEVEAEVAAEVEAEVAAEVAVETEVAAEVAVEVVADVDATAEVRPGAWEWVVGPTLPAVVQENAVLTVGDELWVMGGFQNLQLVDAVRVLKPGAASWVDGPTLPRTLHHMNAAVAAGQVFVLGSLQDFGFAAIGNSWRLDPKGTEGWTVSTPMPNARRRGSAGVAVVGDSVYIVGGFRGSAVAEVDVFDVTRPDAEDAWTALADLPGERDHGAAVAYEGKVYYFGGRDSDISAVRGDVWRFDPTLPGDGWVARAAMPTARGGIVAAVYRGRMIVIGGEGNEAVGTGVFPDVEAYDPVNDTWEVLPAMHTPRHGTGASVVGDALWVPGGADVQAFGATDVVEYLVWRP